MLAIEYMEQNNQNVLKFVVFTLILFLTMGVLAEKEDDVLDTITLTKNTEWYCLDDGRLPPNVGQTYKFDSELDNVFSYIFAKKDLDDNNKIKGDFTARNILKQEAIWYYVKLKSINYNFDGFEFKGIENSDIIGENEVSPAAKKLLVEALSSGYNSDNSALNLSNTNGKMSKTSDGTSLVSEYMAIDTKIDGTYDVEINTSNVKVAIIDENGDEKKSFDKDEKFAVKISTDSIKNMPQISLNVTVQKENVRAYRYYPIDEEHDDYRLQPIAIANKFLTPLSKQLEVNTGYQNMIVIEKSDNTNNKQILLKKADGSIVDKIEMKDSAYILTDLSDGKYVLEEVTDDNKTKTVTFQINNKNSFKYISTGDFSVNNSNILLYLMISIVLLVILMVCLSNYKKKKMIIVGQR